MGYFRSLIRGEIGEECCFECKDSGDDLRVCSYKNCFKSYHGHCTVAGCFPPGEPFICNWHSCVQCKESSYYQCLCCPNYSVCYKCIEKVEFYKLGKQNNGLCGPCLHLAISIEKNAADSREKLCYEDSDVGVILFKDYWNIIKDTEHLTLVDLEAASWLRDRGKGCTHQADSEKFSDEDNKTDEDSLSDSDDNEQAFPSGFKSKSDKMNASAKTKRSKKRIYLGWGTKELIELLSCFGKDTKEPLDESGVVGVVKEYIQQKGLFLGNKKKCFKCDDKLRPLFTRRKVRYNMLHSKLRMHLAANAVSEDESLDGSEDDGGPIMKKKPQASLEPKIAEMVSERNKRCLASLNLNNIKLIYLRRTLVADLLKHQDTFEQKVVGCFVRVKNVVLSHFNQKSISFQLGFVTGIKKSQEKYKINDTFTDVILCVAGFWGDVKITMLSEENIEEEECNELIPLVEKGILKRATVAEFEEKASAVHADIVNHWINRELKRLEKEINLAHEKGWHKEMGELMDKKKLLSTPAERQRRHEVVPEIVADVEDEKETKLKITAGNSCQVNTGVEEYASESFEVLKEKLSEGTTEQAGNAFNVQDEETSKDATEKMAHSLSLNEEPSEVASKQGGPTHEVASEAGIALSSGVTPGSVLHSPVYMAQDGNKAEAMTIDKDESNYTEHNKCSNISVHEVVMAPLSVQPGGGDEEGLQPGNQFEQAGRRTVPRPRRPNRLVTGPEWVSE